MNLGFSFNVKAGISRDMACITLLSFNLNESLKAKTLTSLLSTLACTDQQAGLRVEPLKMAVLLKKN